MKIEKQTSYKIVHDDGTPVDSQLLEELIALFMGSKVLGQATSISQIQALRMAEIALNFHISKTADSEKDADASKYLFE